MPDLASASSDAHFQQILELQSRHLRGARPARDEDEGGFVYLRHDLPLLRRMAAELPQAIALSAGRVVGYCLSLPLSMRDDIAGFAPLFAELERCRWHGRALLSHRMYLGGQVCVERGQRGQGLAAALYGQVRRSLAPGYDVCVTEVAARNRPSLRAHERAGFQAIAGYRSDGEDWQIVACDLGRERPADRPAGP